MNNFRMGLMAKILLTIFLLGVVLTAVSYTHLTLPTNSLV